MERPNQSKLPFIAAAALVIVVFGWSLITYINHHGKVGVKVVLLPSDSSLTIDGEAARAGTIYFTKTTHTLKASRHYFTDATKTVNFASYDASRKLYLEPSPDSYQAKQYLLQHPELQQQREAAEGERSSQIQQQLHKDKLVPLLPYAGPANTYVVDYTSDTGADGVTQKITIIIEANTDQTKQAALDWIKQQGADPAKLTITYQALSAPAAGTTGGSEYQ